MSSIRSTNILRHLTTQTRVFVLFFKLCMLCWSIFFLVFVFTSYTHHIMSIYMLGSSFARSMFTLNLSTVPFALIVQFSICLSFPLFATLFLSLSSVLLVLSSLSRHIRILLLSFTLLLFFLLSLSSQFSLTRFIYLYRPHIHVLCAICCLFLQFSFCDKLSRNSSRLTMEIIIILFSRLTR